MNEPIFACSRREFFGRLGTGLGGIALTSLLQREAAGADSRQARQRILEVFTQERMIEQFRRVFLAAIEGDAVPVS